ncbi:MAG: hypothetical protein IT564_11630 [Rhodospirillales bacterium]|nr:hypothetical protein [Rhodospirillales bacterium]
MAYARAEHQLKKGFAMNVTIEAAKESTDKLSWFDDMIRHYSALQWHCGKLLEAMALQRRHDEYARKQLKETYVMSQNKLEALNSARASHFAKHTDLMARLLESEE